MSSSPLPYEKIVGWSFQYAELQPHLIMLSETDIPKEYRPKVAEQVLLKDKLRSKLPEWSERGVYIPHRVNLEQATSEPLAKYKQCFIKEDTRLLDLTAGLGVDSYYMAQPARQTLAVEQDEALYDASCYNQQRLGDASRRRLCCLDSTEHLEQLLKDLKPNLIYIDPARRTEGDRYKRVYLLEDMQPNILALIPRIKAFYEERALPLPRLLLKLSPMLDITALERTLSGIEEIHIVSLRGEVRELLLYLRLDDEASATPKLYVAELEKEAGEVYELPPIGNTSVGRAIVTPKCGLYLYEPSSGMAKASGYSYLRDRYQLEAISTEGRLMVGQQLHQDFPGRVSEILAVHPFSKASFKLVGDSYPRAQIISYSPKIDTQTLAKKLKTKEGEHYRILAYRGSDKKDMLVISYLC